MRKLSAGGCKGGGGNQPFLPVHGYKERVDNIDKYTVNKKHSKHTSTSPNAESYTGDNRIFLGSTPVGCRTLTNP